MMKGITPIVSVVAIIILTLGIAFITSIILTPYPSPAVLGAPHPCQMTPHYQCRTMVMQPVAVYNSSGFFMEFVKNMTNNNMTIESLKSVQESNMTSLAIMNTCNQYREATQNVTWLGLNYTCETAFYGMEDGEPIAYGIIISNASNAKDKVDIDIRKVGCADYIQVWENETVC